MLPSVLVTTKGFLPHGIMAGKDRPSGRADRKMEREREGRERQECVRMQPLVCESVCL